MESARSLARAVLYEACNRLEAAVMRGCRSLSDQELPQVLEGLSKTSNPKRDLCLCIVGIRTGFRISELLSLTLGDVVQNGRIVHEILVQRRNMKGKRRGRSVKLHEEARAAIAELVLELQGQGHTAPETPLFLSREKGPRGELRPLNRRTAWALLKRAYAAAGLTGKLATHTLRKTFAKRMKENVGGDLHALQKLLGHAQITSTMSYVELDEDKLEKALLK